MAYASPVTTQGTPANHALQLGLPLTLTRLQNASEGAERERAWADFVAAHSDVVLLTCRSVVREHDLAMDAYAHVLEALREENHRRLRSYVPDGKTKFTTWLLVVTRRLALDHVRRRYGRSRSTDDNRRAEQTTRRRLEDLVAAEIEPDDLPGTSRDVPDASIRRAELLDALRQAVAALAPEDRLLLVLRFVDERPVRAIATTLRLPTVFHVYRRMSAVLSTLRDALRRRGVEGAEP